MITFTCIDPPSIYSSEWRYLHLFLIELRPVVLQPPRFHVFGEVLHHAGDDITVPRPGVLAVILTGSRRMIRVGVVPADHLQAALTRRLLSRAKIFRRNHEAVARRIVVPVHQRKQVQHLAPASRVAAQNGAAALVGGAFRRMGANSQVHFDAKIKDGFLCALSPLPRIARSEMYG